MEHWKTISKDECGSNALDAISLALLQTDDAQLLTSASGDIAVLVSLASIETCEGFRVRMVGVSPAGFAYCGAVVATDTLTEALAGLSSLGTLLLRSELTDQLGEVFTKCGTVEQNVDASNPNALRILRYMPSPLDALRSGAPKGQGESEDNLEKRAEWAKKRGLSD